MVSNYDAVHKAIRDNATATITSMFERAKPAIQAAVNELIAMAPDKQGAIDLLTALSIGVGGTDNTALYATVRFDATKCDYLLNRICEQITQKMYRELYPEIRKEEAA